MESRRRHEPRACFHKPARQQNTLADRVAAVSIPHLLGLFAQIESVPDRWVEQHLGRLRREPVHVGVLGAFVHAPIPAVDNLQQS